KAIVDVQRGANVDYAGPLAGYDGGVYDINGRRVLVTESPKVVRPAEGNWPTLRAIIENMFAEPADAQLAHLFGWLHVAQSALLSRRWQPGQALALAGPVSSCKSLFQKIVTALFG